MESFCRLCGCRLFPDPLLVLNGVPKAAQYLPRKEELGLKESIDLTLCQCSGCGLIQLINEPVEYYKEVITSAAWSEKMRSFRTRQMKEFIDHFSLAGKTMVEIGCGEGYLLEILKECGVSAVGIESSSIAIAEGRKAGREIIEGYIDREFKMANCSLDSFVTINFLEHAPDPNSILRGIYRNLATDAVGLIEVPNLEKVLTHNRYYDFIADHLSYFTIDTLRFALEKNGFKVLECYPTWGGDDITAIVRKRNSIDIGSKFGEVTNLVRDLYNVVNGYQLKNRRIAIWGASHQALTLLSLSGIRDIAYIVDSAPFKQGRYAPILHFPIVHPETLINDPIDLVIVMAAGYSDEVVQVLKKMNLNIDIAILKEDRIEII